MTSVTVQMTIVGRSVEDVALFMRNLEDTPAFSEVFANEDTLTEDGHGAGDRGGEV